MLNCVSFIFPFFVIRILKWFLSYKFNMYSTIIIAAAVYKKYTLERPYYFGSLCLPLADSGIFIGF